jgi:hypothetical protein
MAPDPTAAPLVELGALVSVEYETIKTGDGPSIYHHAFGDRHGRGRPVLVVNGEGRLLIVGGKYRVQRRGIVG